MFLKISQDSQENTCARVSFLIKLQVSVCNFIKKETLAQVFSCEVCKNFKNTFFTEQLWTTASKIWICVFLQLHSQTMWQIDSKNRSYTKDQYTVLEFQFRSVECMVDTKLSKNFEQLSFPIQAIQGDTVCWCKQYASKGFQTCLYCIYSFKSYDKSIIILLRNSLTKIWSKITKIRLILWMIYTCNVLEDIIAGNWEKRK